jgi:F-type H+-transporting ATPase subunit b
MDILFNENTFSAIFWTGLVFGTLVVVLAVYGWPRILAALQAREQRILETIEKAEEKNRDAEALLEKYKEQLEKARVDARKIIEEGKADAESLKQRTLEEQTQEAETLKKRALREIELARDKALAEMREETVQMGVEIASRLIRKNLSASDHKTLIEEALAEAEEATEG